MYVTVQLPTTEMIYLEICQNDTIEEIKANISTNKINLFYNQLQLDNWKLVSDYNIQPNDILYVGFINNTKMFSDKSSSGEIS